MRLKSDTNVHSAKAVSRIRTRQSVTKTRSMCVAIHGHAQLSPDTTRLSTIRQPGLANLIPAATAAMSFRDLAVALGRVP